MTAMIETTAPGPIPARDDEIRIAQGAVMERMRANLAAACSTVVTHGRIEEGLKCHVTQGKHCAILDLGRGMGGDAAGPAPGFFARAAVVGCVGIGVKMLAAREGVVFRAVAVTVETDFDDAALMGLSERTAAPYCTRIRIEIDTDTDRATVEDLVDRALATDPWYLALRDAQVVDHALTLRVAAGERAATE